MEEEIKILEEFKKNGYHMLLMKYGDRNKTNLKLERAIESLIKAYKDLQEIEQYHKAENGKLKESLDEHMKLNAELISKIKQTLEENKAKTDCRYCNNACDSYAVCEVLKELLKEGE